MMMAKRNSIRPNFLNLAGNRGKTAKIWISRPNKFHRAKNTGKLSWLKTCLIPRPNGILYGQISRIWPENRPNANPGLHPPLLAGWGGDDKLAIDKGGNVPEKVENHCPRA